MPENNATAVHCVDGKVHQLIYLGAALQSYRCSLCGTVISKAAIKQQTEPQLSFIMPKEEPLA